jgi:hypothetical protein
MIIISSLIITINTIITIKKNNNKIIIVIIIVILIMVIIYVHIYIQYNIQYIARSTSANQFGSLAAAAIRSQWPAGAWTPRHPGDPAAMCHGST